MREKIITRLVEMALGLAILIGMAITAVVIFLLYGSGPFRRKPRGLRR